MVSAETMTTPLARPSMLSMRLMALVMPMTQKMVANAESIERGGYPPGAGEAAAVGQGDHPRHDRRGDHERYPEALPRHRAHSTPASSRGEGWRLREGGNGGV